MTTRITISTAFVAMATACIGFVFSGVADDQQQNDRIQIIIDTDANNEVDDQHALAYALFSSDIFDIRGVTVNHTSRGNVDSDYAEAQRVMTLCGAWGTVPLYKGANSRYMRIRPHLADSNHDGHEAVNFIIQAAHEYDRNGGDKLVLAPIGKLTNIALALEKDPSIVPKVKVIWLGGHYRGRDGSDREHNLRHDPESYNAVIESGVEFEMVTVRYGASTGTSAVTVHVDTIREKMPGKGPHITPGITGRHGGTFNNWGDYSVNLFVNYTSGRRPLFDLCVFSILRNPSWAEVSTITAPKLDGSKWSGTFEGRQIKLWENFNRDAIIDDFFRVMDNPLLVAP